MKKVFLICPVRNATEEQITFMSNYKKSLKEDGVMLYYPAEDNPYELTDNVGYQICRENLKHIINADEIHIFWDATSTGTLFDLGAAFALNKKIFIINPKDVVRTPTKSFSNMIWQWYGAEKGGEDGKI